MRTDLRAFLGGGVTMFAVLLGGCSTASSGWPTAVVVMVKNGATILPTWAESRVAQKSISAALAERNLRIVDNSRDAYFVATVEVRDSRDGKQLELVQIRDLTINREWGQHSGETEYTNRKPPAHTWHPSIKLAEENEAREQMKGSSER